MPAVPQSRVVATLGGPGTFAGQATQAFLMRDPAIGPVEYLPTMDEVWEAASSGAVDSAVLTSETTNTSLQEIATRLLAPGSGLSVNGEVLVPYHCLLLGKPGTRLEQIRLVLGHGSLVHCRRYLAEHLPRAEVRMHEKNSLAAAAEVLAGDGSIAVVGTALSAQSNGLAVLARDVDLGSVGSWWIMSRQLRVSPQPDVVLVAVSSTSPAALSDLLAQARSVGLTLRGIAPVPAGRLFGYHYLVVFRAAGVTGEAVRVLGVRPGCRLLGAFPSGAVASPGRALRRRVRASLNAEALCPEQGIPAVVAAPERRYRKQTRTIGNTPIRRSSTAVGLPAGSGALNAALIPAELADSWLVRKTSFPRVE
jgi:prephenate dehydratase